MVLMMQRWDQAAIPEALWRSPVAYFYASRVSLVAGWDELSDLDAAQHHPVARKLA